MSPKQPSKSTHKEQDSRYVSDRRRDAKGKETPAARLSELEKQDEKFRVLFSNSKDPTVVTDLEGKIIDINPAGCEHFKVGYKKLITKNIMDLAYSENGEQGLREILAWAATGDTQELEGLSIIRHEHELAIEIRASRIHYERAPAILLQLSNVTAEAQTRYLSERAEDLKLINEMAIEFSAAVSPGQIKEIACQKLRQISRGMLVWFSNYEPEQACINIERADGLPHIFKAFEKVLHTQVLDLKFPIKAPIPRSFLRTKVSKVDGFHQLTWGYVTKSGDTELRKATGVLEIYHLSLQHGDTFVGTMALLMGSKQRQLSPETLETFCNLVTASLIRNEAEESIRQYQTQLRWLASQVSLVEERQRRNIATSLHDHVIQSLALAKVKLAGVGAETNLSEHTNYQETQALLKESIEQLRTLTFQLSPPILYELGFEPAVEWLAEQMTEQHGFSFQCKAGDSSTTLNGDARVLTFQSVRELFVNAAKHAQAKVVTATLWADEEYYHVVVKDNGRGFDTSIQTADRQNESGFGLFSIRERMDRINGSLEIQSTPGVGTEIQLTVPLTTSSKESTS